jgi:hypothetical protein
MKSTKSGDLWRYYGPWYYYKSLQEYTVSEPRIPQSEYLVGFVTNLCYHEHTIYSGISVSMRNFIKYVAL